MTRIAVLLVFSLTLSLAAQSAVRSTPRFHLPAIAFDYTPPTANGLPLPSRNVVADVANARAALGRVLFYDPLLSRNGTRSCGSCHRQAHAFTDGKATSRGFSGIHTARNSMSLVNLAAHYGGLFWDGRAPTLENAVLQPIQNPVEMGMTLDELEARLAAQPDYAPLFAAAFGDTDVGSKRIASALAAFVRAIVSVRSRYDDGLAAAGRMGVDVDFANFTAAENHGKRLFFGEPTTRSRSCAACHVERIESCCGACWSVVPAAFDSRTCTNNGVDAGHPWDDPGRGGVTQWAKDRGAFRAPSLRNVELTAPYMHDGRFATLDDVLRFYSGRVRAHPNLHRALAQACWSPRPQFAAIAGPTLGFQFNSRDRDDLVAFLKTLTDRSLVADPRFADPFAPSAR